MSSSQKEFFKLIKSKINENTNLAFELSDLLDVSIDSVYRRLRGQTQLSLDETFKLCEHFQIPLSSLHKSPEAESQVNFEYKPLVSKDADILRYLSGLEQQLLNVQKAAQKQIIYAATDIPVSWLFRYPELAMFKINVWRQNMIDNMISPLDFSNEPFFSEVKDLMGRIVKAYNRIPSTEIWTSNTTSSMLNNLGYFCETESSQSRMNLKVISEQYLDLLRSMKQEAERFTSSMFESSSHIKVYICDIEIENNYIFIQADAIKVVFMKLYILNSMRTVNPRFCEETELWLKNLISKSTLISGVSQKVRNQFFKQELRKAEEVISQINEYSH